MQKNDQFSVRKNAGKDSYVLTQRFSDKTSRILLVSSNKKSLISRMETFKKSDAFEGWTPDYLYVG